jgi:hypothetical protein
MPTISIFYGIMIRMFFNDHPPPHFHARYGEFEAISRHSNCWKAIYRTGLCPGMGDDT